MIPQKSPELLLRMLDDEFGFVVNCSFPGSLRIINSDQRTVLDAIDGKEDVTALGQKIGIDARILGEFLSSLTRTEIARFDGAFSKPTRPQETQRLNLWIHTTNACNLNCGYCYISTLNTGKAMSDHVKTRMIDKLVQTVEQRQIKQVKFRLAGGEPLSQFRSWEKFIPEARAALADAGCQLDCAFLTNLTILNNEIVAFSKQHHLTYGVSLDGVGNVHDATRKFRSGAGSFHIVDANIRKLIASGIPVSVNTVVSNHNLNGLGDLTRYLIGLNIPFRYSIVKGENIDAQLLDNCLSSVFTIMEEAMLSGWQFSNHFQFCDLKPGQLGFQTCASGFSGGAIYIDGTFQYCHVDFGKHTGPAFSIFDEEFDLVDMITLGAHHEDVKSDDCKKCRYRFVCTSGCPVYRVDGKDPQCSLYHKFIPMFYSLMAKERLKLLKDCKMIA